MALAKGMKVRQKVPVVQGEISALAIVDDVVQYQVEYVDENGEGQQRFFREEELEEVT